MTGSSSRAISAQGQDVSDYQPVQTVADWKRYDFGFCKATEGTGWTGATFADNWVNLEAAGIPRGAYHFLHPGGDPVAQAQHFYSVVKANGLKAGDMLVVDSELMSGVHDIAWAGERLRREHVPAAAADLAATPAQVDTATKAFLDELGKLLIADGYWKRVGFRKAVTCPMVTYTMHAVGQYLTETAGKYPNLWFAWPSNTAPPADMFAPWPEWLIWQWSFSAPSGGDSDAWNGSVADMKAFIAKYLPAPKPVKKVRKLIYVTADGKTSLTQYAAKARTNSAWIISWTFRRINWTANVKFGAYVLAAQWNKALPKGTKLAIWETIETPGA